MPLTRKKVFARRNTPTSSQLTMWMSFRAGVIVQKVASYNGFSALCVVSLLNKIFQNNKLRGAEAENISGLLCCLLL